MRSGEGYSRPLAKKQLTSQLVVFVLPFVYEHASFSCCHGFRIQNSGSAIGRFQPHNSTLLSRLSPELVDSPQRYCRNTWVQNRRVGHRLAPQLVLSQVEAFSNYGRSFLYQRLYFFLFFHLWGSFHVNSRNIFSCAVPWLKNFLLLTETFLIYGGSFSCQWLQQPKTMVPARCGHSSKISRF